MSTNNLTGSSIYRRRRWDRSFIAIATAAIAVAGCIGGHTVTYKPPTETWKGRLVQGLSEEAGFEAARCIWLDTPAGVRLTVIWPSPLEDATDGSGVVDADGGLVAEIGDVVRITGPGGGIGESVCGGYVFAANTMQVVGQDVIHTPVPYIDGAE